MSFLLFRALHVLYSLKCAIYAHKKQYFEISFFLNNWVWTPELRPGTSKIGFLVKNYPYSEIVRTLGPDLGPYTSILFFKNYTDSHERGHVKGGVHKLQIFGREKCIVFSNCFW